MIKLIKKLLIAAVSFFGLTFAIYWFNLDSKLVWAIFPTMIKHYDDMERDRKL